MDVQTRRRSIEKYKDGFRAVSEALQGATDKELDARPAPGKWSAREIVHHLADSEMTSAIRLRRLITEDRPVIQGYDQDEYARRLYYQRPIQASLDAFRAARETTAHLLERMTEAEWAREGTHSESGRYTVERWLEIYADHAHNHAEQIRRARAAAR
ncbi:MAG: DinB family protein [candidate division NC10 bacterium]|nr:DinB family protein [candidate division NC10 bacterium]